MDYFSFLDQIIKDGIYAVKLEFKSPEERQKLFGSIQGFEQCRGKKPSELARLLEKAREETIESQIPNTERARNKYWFYRFREIQIEWVCSCVSAILKQNGLPTITPVSMRAFIKASQVLVFYRMSPKTK
jgi:hypothetical protein